MYQVGIESNADKVGATAATVVGAGIAVHAGLTALRQARAKAATHAAPASGGSDAAR